MSKGLAQVNYLLGEVFTNVVRGQMAICTVPIEHSKIPIRLGSTEAFNYCIGILVSLCLESAISSSFGDSTILKVLGIFV